MSWVSEARASTILYNYLIGLEAGYEFLIPANVCPIVLATFKKAGVCYRLVDISPVDYAIDEGLVEDVLKNEREKKGLLYVRTYGAVNDKAPWFKKLRTTYPGLRIIDDRCLCKPSFEDAVLEDGVDMVLFSTGYAKFVEFNEGGFACLSKAASRRYDSQIMEYSEHDHEMLVKQFNQSISTKTPFEYFDSCWLNARPLPEGWGDYKLRIKKQVLVSAAQKSLINQIYMNEIPSDVFLGESFNDWRFSILVENKGALLRAIFDAGYFASSHYASLSGIFDNKRAPVAEKMSLRVVNLFNDFRVNPEQACSIAKIVKGYC